MVQGELVGLCAEEKLSNLTIKRLVVYLMTTLNEKSTSYVMKCFQVIFVIITL